MMTCCITNILMNPIQIIIAIVPLLFHTACIHTPYSEPYVYIGVNTQRELGRGLHALMSLHRALSCAVMNDLQSL